MKKCFFSIFLLLIGLQMMAQEFYPKWDSIAGQRKSRLVWHRRTIHTPGGIVNLDSTYYRYSGDNSWYNEKYGWMYDECIATNKRLIRTYSGNGDVMTETDTLLSGKWKSILVSDYIANGWQDMEFIYDSSWRTTKEIYYTIDFFKQVICDSTIYYTPPKAPEKREYTYTSDGLTKMLLSVSSGIMYVPKEKEEISYYLHKKTDHAYSSYQAGNNKWKMTKRIHYLYNSNFVNTSLQIETWDANGMLKTTREDYHYSTAGDIDTVTMYDMIFGTPIKNARMIIDYNSFHQPLAIMHQVWDTAAKMWTFINAGINDYYQYFEFGLDVVEPLYNKSEVKVYPIPARNILNIVYNIPDGPLQLSIYTKDGRLMHYWKTYNTGIGNMETIDVSTLPTDSYILKVINNSKVYTKELNIVK